MKEQIMNELGQLLKNTEWWGEHKSFSMDEIAVRFHHRLVQIHIFVNGNGRHARLMTDLLLEKNGIEKFSWGALSDQSGIEVEGSKRAQYIAALQKADQDDFAELIKFVRS